MKDDLIYGEKDGVVYCYRQIQLDGSEKLYDYYGITDIDWLIKRVNGLKDLYEHGRIKHRTTFEVYEIEATSKEEITRVYTDLTHSLNDEIDWIDGGWEQKESFVFILAKNLVTGEYELTEYSFLKYGPNAHGKYFLDEWCMGDIDRKLKAKENPDMILEAMNKYYATKYDSS